MISPVKTLAKIMVVDPNPSDYAALAHGAPFAQVEFQVEKLSFAGLMKDQLPGALANCQSARSLVDRGFADRLTRRVDQLFLLHARENP